MLVERGEPRRDLQPRHRPRAVDPPRPWRACCAVGRRRGAHRRGPGAAAAGRHPAACAAMPARLRALGWAPRRTLADAMRDLWDSRCAWRRRRGGTRRAAAVMKILVTGGTGFLGRAVVRQLAPRHRLRLLVRPAASRQRFPDGVEFAAGDVTDRAEPRARRRRLRRGRPRRGAGQDPRARGGVRARQRRRARQRARGGAGGGRARASSTSRASSPSGRPKGCATAWRARAMASPSGAGRRVDQPYERTKALADRAARARHRRGRAAARRLPGRHLRSGRADRGQHRGAPPARPRAPADCRRCSAGRSGAGTTSFVDDVAAGIAAVLERAPAGVALRAGRRERHPGGVLSPGRRS